VPKTNIAITAKQSTNFVCLMAVIDMKQICRNPPANQATPFLCLAHFVISSNCQPELAKKCASIFFVIPSFIVSAPLAQAANAAAIRLKTEGGPTALARGTFTRGLGGLSGNRVIDFHERITSLALPDIAHYTQHCRSQVTPNQGPTQSVIAWGLFMFRKGNIPPEPLYIDQEQASDKAQDVVPQSSKRT
jgi:hypothetical protein